MRSAHRSLPLSCYGYLCMIITALTFSDISSAVILALLGILRATIQVFDSAVQHRAMTRFAHQKWAASFWEDKTAQNTSPTLQPAFLSPPRFYLTFNFLGVAGFLSIRPETWPSKSHLFSWKVGAPLTLLFEILGRVCLEYFQIKPAWRATHSYSGNLWAIQLAIIVVMPIGFGVMFYFPET